MSVPATTLVCSLLAKKSRGNFMSHGVEFFSAMPSGTVVFFNDTGGYGFIETEASEDDVFFHMEDVGGPDLEEGQEVEFEITQSDKGPRAENLTRL
jgi:CspA family cold shock protein